MIGDEGDRYTDPGWWIDTARTVEDYGFHGMFFADVLAPHSVHAGRPDDCLRDGAQAPSLDPLSLVTMLAGATTRMGLAATVSTTYTRPALLARQLSTIDHLSRGRLGVNLVTSYSNAAATLLGMPRQMEHDERYDHADDVMEACYRLWNSWRSDAVLRDPLGDYADPDLIDPVTYLDRNGEVLVDGVFPTEPSPQRIPLLCQAGASPRGRRFAGRHAEMAFVNALKPERCRATIARLRRALAAAGRDPAGVSVLALFTIIVAPTDTQAHAIAERHRRAVTFDKAMARFGGWLGIDLSGAALDVPVGQLPPTDAIQSLVGMFSGRWTPRQIAARIGLGGTGAMLVGSPTTVVDQLLEWRAIAGFDGINLGHASTPHSWRAFAELVMPELARRGVLADPPQAGMTLRRQVTGRDTVSDDHPAAMAAVAA